jgi:hypothetical protein
VTVAVTANVSQGTGSTRSVVPVTRTVTSAAVIATETRGPVSTPLPIWLMTCGGGAALDAGGGQRLPGRRVRDALGLLPDRELDNQQDQQHQQRHRDDDLGAARPPVTVRPGPFRPPGTRTCRPAGFP